MRKILILLLLAVSLMARGTVYYVATTGNDGTGDGSSGTPWLTVGYAVTQATAGDTIYVTAGTYNISTQVAVPVGVSIMGAGATTIITSASALNPILLLSSAAENTNGSQSISFIKFDGDSISNIAINVIARGNTKVHDCTFDSFLDNGVRFTGRLAAGEGAPTTYAEDNYLYNCIFIDCGGEVYSEPYYYASPAISIGGQKDPRIFYNIVYSNNGTYGYGISTNKSGYNCGGDIYGNYIYTSPKHLADNQWNFAIELWNNRGGMTIRDNYVTGAIDIGGTSSDDSQAYGFAFLIQGNIIEMAGLQPYDHTGIIIESDITGGGRITGNYLKNFNNAISLNTLSGPVDHQEDITIDHNIILETVKTTGNYSGRAIGHGTAVSGSTYEDIRILHNTIYTWSYKASAAVHFASSGVTYTNTLIQNNISNNAYNAFRFENNTLTGLDINNNCFYGQTNAVSFVSVTASDTTISGNLYSTNPLFKSSSDFHLQSISPCRDAGIDVSAITGGTDFHGASLYGAAYDIGAFEYGTGRLMRLNDTILPTINYKVVLIDH